MTEIQKWAVQGRSTDTISIVHCFDSSCLSTLADMEVHLRPETESRLQELAAKTGRAPNDLLEDAMAAYLEELAQVRDMFDGRYDDIKSGRAKLIDGEESFATLRSKSRKLRTGH